MKTLIYSAAVVALMTASPALAADLLDAVAEPEASGDWTGFYIGGHAGWATGAAADSLDCPVLDGFYDPTTIGSITTFGAVGDAEFSMPAYLPIRTLCGMSPEDAEGLIDFGTDVVGGYLTSQSGDTEGAFSATQLENPADGSINLIDDVSGWLLGGQMGYLVQSGQMVFGAEVNASLTSMRDTGVQYIATGAENFLLVDLMQTEEINVGWMASAVGRLGFAVNESLLLSADAGLALAGVSYSNQTTPFGTWSDEGVYAGWTAGVQADLKITDNISLFASYTYTEIRDMAFDGTTSTNISLFPEDLDLGVSGAAEYDLQVHAIKTGFNYHFN